MNIGFLKFEPLANHHELVAGPVWKATQEMNLAKDLFISEIDPKLADTEAFCEKYNVGLDISANCVIVKAKRAERTWYVACMILATDMIDVNNIVRRHINARKISFAPVDTATKLTNMKYGGITPIGLPSDWQILIDSSVAPLDTAIIGSGIRGSKIALPGKILAKLQNSEILDIKKS